jgi:S1-C subfamily serine protease
LNLVDLAIVAALVAAVIHGYVLGAAIQVTSFGGFWAGFALGSVLAPHVADTIDDQLTRSLVALLVVFGVASLVGAFGRAFGVRIWRALRSIHLGWLDRGAGVVVATVGTLFAVWFLAAMLATFSVREVATEIQRSRIVHALDEALPPPPALFARVERLLRGNNFLSPFVGLEPAPSGRLPAPADPLVRRAVDAAGAATVKIVGFGCGGELEGSGFVAASDLVVTNAHVVAGISAPVVIDGKGEHEAVTVRFDPDLDIAVLRVSGLAAGPLPLAAGDASRGTEGAVLGYPGGGPFDAEPAVVLDQFTAEGRDIYGRSTTSRDIYEVQANVRPGNSGGPLVRPDGTVVGVVFSKSLRANDIGYAIVASEVAPEVRAAASQRAPVGTGGCAQE